MRRNLVSARNRSVSLSVIIGTFSFLTLALQVEAKTYLVDDQAAYKDAVKKLSPGDELVLADGEWRDFEIVFSAAGEKDNPIILTAETPGKVLISGSSNLRISGEHLIVKGLTFKNGTSPTNSVISFRTRSDHLSNNVRFTENAIIGFNKGDRREQDNWIMLFGKNNRVDHNYFAGKTNKGPTLVVRLNTEESRSNNHSIDHNFFGYRPPLGGNGGETIRIGVSDYSRTRSDTLISQNYFERSSGEVEIISIKAEGNKIAENVFYESRGAVVFRHGGNNEISRNVFFGNGVVDTGGVRVINENQTVKDNYFEGLRGQKFMNALTIMNGVPNSPINRYHQVRNSSVTNNSFIDIKSIGLAVGSDEERSAAPVDNIVSGNLFLSDARDPVSVFDDISGIAFEENISNNEAFVEFGSSLAPSIDLERAENGLLYPVNVEAYGDAGAPRDLAPIGRQETGPTWFEKPDLKHETVAPQKIGKGAAALKAAVEEAAPGAVLRLKRAAYELDEPLIIDKPITIVGGGKKTKISSAGESVFVVKSGAALTIKRATLSASSATKSLIHARGETYTGAYSLALKNVSFAPAKEAAASGAHATVLSADPETFASKVYFSKVTARDWPGSIIALSGAGLDGWYLADDVIVAKSKFSNIGGSLISFGRDGRDESTFGPRFKLQGSKLTNVAADAVAVDLNGIDGLGIVDNMIDGVGKMTIKKRVLGLDYLFTGNTIENSPAAEFTGVNGETISVPKSVSQK